MEKIGRSLEKILSDPKLTSYRNPIVDHIQPNAFVEVVKTKQGKLKLALGERTYSGAEIHQTPADGQSAYIVESPDVEIGYLLVINTFSDRKASLSGYTTDLGPNENLKIVLKNLLS